MTTGRINQVASINDSAHHASVAPTNGKQTCIKAGHHFKATENLRETMGKTTHVHLMHRIQENSKYMHTKTVTVEHN